MHEFGIIQGIFETIEKAAKEHHLKSIQSVTLCIGRLRQCMPDFLEFAFEELSKGTLAEGAKLIVKEIPIRMQCKSCQKEFTVERQTYICPHCEGTKLTILAGKEIMLESMEGEK